MSTVALEKEKTVLIQSDKVDTVVFDNKNTITVTEVSSNTVSHEVVGNLVHEEEYKEYVVQGGLQGPPGIPGSSTQFEYHIAGSVLGGNRAVTLSSNNTLVYPDVVSPTSFLLGLTTGSAVLGSLREVQITGTQTEPSWNWTPGLPVFVSTNGVLTQTPPQSGQVLIIGWAAGPTKLVIDKQPPIFME